MGFIKVKSGSRNPGFIVLPPAHLFFQGPQEPPKYLHLLDTYPAPWLRPPQSWLAPTVTLRTTTRHTAEVQPLRDFLCSRDACYAFYDHLDPRAVKKADLENSVGSDNIAPSLHGEKIIVSKKSSHGVGTGVRRTAYWWHVDCKACVVCVLQAIALAIGGASVPCCCAETHPSQGSRPLCRWAMDLRLPRVRGARQRVHPRVRAQLCLLPARMAMSRAFRMPAADSCPSVLTDTHSSSTGSSIGGGAPS